MGWIINSIPNISWYILSQGLSLLRVIWYVPKTILNWTFLKHQEKKKDQLLFHYFSVSFTSELPGSLWSQSKNWQNTTGKAALTVFLAHQNFREKASFHEISFPFYKPKKTQDISDKVQISIQIFSCARWTTKPFNMFTSLFGDKGKKSARILIQCEPFWRSTIYQEGIRD